MNDEALEEIMGQLSGGGEITREQCLYLMQVYESGNIQLTQCVERISELEAKLEDCRHEMHGLEDDWNADQKRISELERKEDNDDG